MAKKLATKSPRSFLLTRPLAMQQKVKAAPLLPGCYLYKNGRGQVLYVGKAKVLRNRVKSYFSNYNRVEEKIRIMLNLAKKIDYVVTDSEIEALIFENVLIKKYKPKYNSMYVDDKSYAYVKFDKVQATKPGEQVTIPTITVTREKQADKAEYFGPYPDTRAVKRLIRRLRKIYPFCTSYRKVSIPKQKDHLFVSKEPRACFHYQIELCNGICFGAATRGEYENNLNNIKKFFKGEKQNLQQEIERDMKKAAKAHNFEQAVKFRNMLFDIKYVGSNLHLQSDIDEVAIVKAKQEKAARAQAELVTRLEFPTDKLQNRAGLKIECYDISNIQGKFAVGSMVVFIDGKPRPELYRRFRIRMANEPNDFAMLQEVLTRRFTHSKAKPDPSFSVPPNLLIIDGGKGQLSSVYKILTSYQLESAIPIVGLAKREEEIFKVARQFSVADSELADQEEFSRILLPKRSDALYLVQRIRDEAHRFAITYHRKLRGKSLTATA